MNPGALRLVNRAFFSVTAAPYDWLASREPWLEHCREMPAHLPRPPPGRPAGASSDPPPSVGTRQVLDLGCGPGTSTLGWLQATDDRVVGLDLSRPMLARARRRLQRAGVSDRSALVCGDALALPFRDGAFDVITGHSVLYLLPDRRRALAELRRVLAPDGTLLLLEPADGFLLRRVARLARRSPGFALTVLGWRMAGHLAGRFAPGSLRATLEEGGFREIRIEPAFEGAGLIALGTRA